MLTEKELGTVSALIMYAALVCAVWAFGETGTVLREMALLLGGDHTSYADHGAAFSAMAPVLLTVVALALPAAYATGELVGALLPKRKGKHAVAEELAGMREGYHFFGFFALCLGEELFARGLFLGALARISFLSGPAAYIGLVLIGNGLWSIVHLANYKRESERHPLRALPQFVAGIFFTFVFTKYGLMASTMAHFGYNAVIFASEKKQRFDRVDAAIIAVAGLTALVAHRFISHPLGDLRAWFDREPVFVLPGWSFGEYFAALTFIESMIVVVSGCFLLDRGEAGNRETLEKHGLRTVLLARMIEQPVVVAIVWVLYGLLGHVTDDLPFRVLTVAILLTFLKRGASGSAVSRTFWASLPEAFLTVCAIQALGFFGACACALAKACIYAPQEILVMYDD